jgi:hypothetical protein
MLKKNCWYIIKRSNKLFLVCGRSIDSFYWGQTSSWCTFYSCDEIIETLGKYNPNLFDTLEKDFYKKYYPPTELSKKEFYKSAGWLSPEGKFYACSPSGHYSLAKRLSIFFYDCIDRPEEVIIEKFWLKIIDTGRVYDIRIEINPTAAFSATQDQIDTLKILTTVGDSDWQDNLLRAIEGYEYV